VACCIRRGVCELGAPRDTMNGKTSRWARVKRRDLVRRRGISSPAEAAYRCRPGHHPSRPIYRSGCMVRARARLGAFIEQVSGTCMQSWTPSHGVLNKTVNARLLFIVGRFLEGRGERPIVAQSRNNRGRRKSTLLRNHNAATKKHVVSNATRKTKFATRS
jgi:hypothetical protein